MLVRHLLAILLGVGLLPNCSVSPQAPDGGAASPDAGTPVDAGEPSDAGAPPDSGTWRDGGVASLEVMTSEGLVQGALEDGIRVFKGIPFAAPPAGPRRWLPPDPPAPRAAPLVAIEPGQACPQPSYPGISATSEDCLTLNIFSPSQSGDHPVLFWIHGGGFVQNWGGNPQFDGKYLASKGIVVVTINYRLGVLGIFAHPSLTAERPAGPLGNFALMDQLAALRWVKQNIRGFGGEPDNVTISGSSAGATSVLFLMSSRSSAGLFDKAIIQSSGAQEDVYNLSYAETAGSSFASSLGVPSNASPASAQALRALSVQQLTAANGAWEATTMPPLANKPLVDDSDTSTLDDANAIVRAAPNDVFIPGGAFQKPSALLIGFTDGESCTRACPQGPLSSIQPVGAMATGVRRAAAVAASGARTYLYYFRFVPGRPSESAKHSASVPYTFGNSSSGDVEARQLNAVIPEYWVSFMKTGQPAATGMPVWPRYDATQPMAMVFSNGSEGGIAPTPLSP
jgi:para-nitrobenzyl esterase